MANMRNAIVTRIMSFVAAMFIGTLAYPTLAVSQMVSVLNGEGEHGYGFMFAHNGNCYVALPRHVAGPEYLPRINLSTAAPVVSGTGSVLRPFWEGIDLALAVASEALHPQCTASLADFSPSRSALTAATAQLLRLQPDGSEDRVQIVIENRGYLSFVGRVAPGEPREIAQGTSGAFAFSRGEPIGMALTSDDPTRATFMRVEEIGINLERYLSQSGGAPLQPPKIDAGPTAESPEGRLPLVLVSSSVPAVNPTLAPENMLGDGMFVFEPARRMIFDFRFEPDEAKPLKRLRLTAPAGGSYAVPKNVLIQASIDVEGAGFSTLFRTQFSPDGVLDTGDVAPRFVRRLRVIVLDTWADGQVAIDRVSAW
ncbi:hypothetical protein [Salipiger mangrovisoli]|uniref:Trypsin-like peptidase domain-containing protein n=1 Tax=Salipiger mangrovisoli TaxID=2865933 RepID=A0ABR9WYF1_9RHOB|nr:hypothetical protein [Salipiger mangrovisoli]MBE9636313.1 hypothetical protein [Salipiger mangrovisoli]